MNKSIKRIFFDITKGENIDVYLTVLLCVLIAVLGVFGMAKIELIAATILAILAILATSILTNRRATDDLKQATEKLDMNFSKLQADLKEKVRVTDVLLPEYPHLGQEIATAKKVHLLSVALAGTATHYNSDFAQIIQKGASLRFISCEPSQSVLEMLAYRSSSINEPETYRQMLDANLARVKFLLKLSKDTEKLQIRTIPYVISYGMIILENDNPKIYVKLVTFRGVGKKDPTFEITKREDPEWYEFFCEQFETLWQAGKPLGVNAV